MINYIKRVVKGILLPILERIEHPVEVNRVLLAKSLINGFRTTKRAPSRLTDVGFKVFSQWDEDGIIQYLISRVPVANKVFVEFGVEDYRESNTRFLLVNDNWKGLIMDSNPSNVRRIRSRDLYSRHNLKALRAFVSRDNINTLLRDHDITGDIGLLSIDVDGNDYWIWEAIEVISPRIVVCEYNSVFGCHDAVTIPYDERFDRTKAHYSNLYFGASLKALCLLAQRKGYIFVGASMAGINAFFVRKDVAGKLKNLNCAAGFVDGSMRESRDASGRFTYISGNDRINVIAHLKVFDVITNQLKRVSDVTM